MKEHEPWDIVEKAVTKPTDPTDLATHEKDIKAQRVIMDVEKNHLILHVEKKTSTKDMFKTLMDYSRVIT